MTNTLQQKILKRNELFTHIRDFFRSKNVLEVDTSLVREFTVTDPYMNAFSVKNINGDHQGFLQTSPEYAMKQLLCKDSGDIFQLSKMFRAEEKSNIHASEFTLLEWYRLGYDHHKLIQEVCELVQSVIGQKKIEITSYQDIFLSTLKIDPFNISLKKLSQLTKHLLGDIPVDLLFDNYLTLLFSEVIEPRFEYQVITVIHGYPASQASLAKVRYKNGLNTADRFEVYTGGMELANGFNELTNANQQLKRFEQDNVIRKKLGYKPVEIDHSFIQSLESNLPDCSGVALGFDRLLMIKAKEDNIKNVML